MTNLLGYAPLSLGTGALYALVAAGVVVIARGAGVINFAHGALVMWAAYFFSAAQENWGLPVAPAGALTVVVTAAIGLAFAVLAMGPLRGSSPLTRAMATLGLLIILQALAGLFFGSQVRSSPSVLPAGELTMFGRVVGVDLFVRLAAVAVVVAVVWAFFRFTTFGLAATAVIDNPRAAATAGWSPDAVAGAAWCVGSALAGLAGVLLAPLGNPLSSTSLIMLVVPALAVALMARFHSLPGVLAGGLALGLVELLTQVGLVTAHPAWTGADRAIPLIVIVFYLVVRGRGIPDRGHIVARHPELGGGRIHPLALGMLLAVALALIWFVLPSDWVTAVGANALWALLMVSLVVLVGFAGQICLGQLVPAGVAALITGRIVAIWHWPLPAALVVGVSGAVAVGLLFALPALRTRGLQLAIVTLGMGAAADAILFQRGYHSPPPAGTAATIFGGLGSPEGTVVGTQSVFGVELDKIDNPDGFATLVLVVFTLVALAVANLRRGRAGRRLIAIRANERAAAALGISVVGAKLYAFALSAAIAGLGGVLYVFYQYGEVGNINYGAGTFAPFGSIMLIAFAVVGGIGWVSGSVAGATLVVGTLGTRIAMAVGERLGGPGWLVHLDRYLPLASGIALIMIMNGSGGGMAADNVRTIRRALDRLGSGWPDRPVRAAARRHRRLARLLAAGRGAGGQPMPVEPVPVRPARLAVAGLTVTFGALTAVRGIDLAVEPGEVVGLIGPNGAGKTSLIDAISGHTCAAAGVVTLGGTPLDQLGASRRARAGIGRSFQHLELFDDLTVLENIQAGSDPRDSRAYLTNLLAARERPLPPIAVFAIGVFRLRDDLFRTVSELPYGRRRLVSVARAVAAAPSVLLLDEPCAGLDQTESAQLARLLRRLTDDWGLAIVINDHDMSVIRGVCDRVVVVDVGRKIAEGWPAEVCRDPRVQAAYLGRPVGEFERKGLAGA
ncbi:ABC transporter permease subunit [Frankia sp. Cas3]|uniref:ABC transporter permease subunit n=1 Tax=Frankia sp. Cas3 TaxID=3073926 RepID=UPI002AD41BA9|nr:ATP-binding cassette domain-containing protein [Frankia sp. Cas3]